MHPTLFHLGPVQVHSYGTLLMVGFLAGILLSRREARRRQLSPDLPLDLGVWVLLASVAGARLIFAALNWNDFASRPVEVFFVWKEGGLSFHGGLLGGIVAALLFCRRHGLSFWVVADMLSPGLALGYALARIGCFLNGCCYGGPTDLPWGVQFPRWPDSPLLTPPSHPAQLYASLGSLLILEVLMSIRSRLRQPGQLFLTYLILYAILRTGVEVFRKGFSAQVLVDGMTEAQVLSAGIIVIAVALLLARRRRAVPPPASPA